MLRDLKSGIQVSISSPPIGRLSWNLARAMKSTLRTVVVKLILVAFLCGQGFVGVSQAAAIEPSNAIDKTAIFLIDSSDNSDSGALVMVSLPIGADTLYLRAFFSDNACLMPLRTASETCATGPPLL